MASEPMEHSYSSYSNTSQDSMQSAFSYPGSCPLSIGQPDIPRSQPPFNPYSDSTGPSSYTYTSTDQLSDYSMALSPYTLPITSLSPVDEQQTLSLDMQNHWDPGFEIPVIPDYLQGTGLSLAATSDPSPEPSRSVFPVPITDSKEDERELTVFSGQRDHSHARHAETHLHALLI